MFLYFMNKKFNENAKIEKLTKALGRGVRLIVIGLLTLIGNINLDSYPNPPLSSKKIRPIPRTHRHHYYQAFTFQSNV